MRPTFTLAFLLVMIAPSPAAIIMQKSAGTPLPQGNLVQYTISAITTQGERIESFSTPSITPISGVGIHQVWQLAGGQTPTEQQHSAPLFNADWKAYDSHFLFDDTETLSVGPQWSETNNGATTGTLGLSHSIAGAPPTSGFGTYMSGASSKVILPPNNDHDVPFMQVVLRAQDSARLVVSIDPDAGSFAYQLPIIIGPFVPEPATWLLAMVAGLSPLSQRRR